MREGESPDDNASDDDIDKVVSKEHLQESFNHTTREDLGCKHFIIHARKCYLHGLSTKENRSVPPLQYDWVFRLLDDFPELDFSLNGGIVNLGVAKDLLDRKSQNGRQLRGIMIGRLLTKSSWLFHYVDKFFYNDKTPDVSRFDIMMQYVDFCEKRMNDKCILQYC